MSQEQGAQIEDFVTSPYADAARRIEEPTRLLKELVEAYDAMFDPETPPGAVNRLQDALTAARKHLGLPPGDYDAVV